MSLKKVSIINHAIPKTNNNLNQNMVSAGKNTSENTNGNIKLEKESILIKAVFKE